MTPEQLEKGKEISEDIRYAEMPIEKIGQTRLDGRANGVIIACLNNSDFSASFKLKPEQIEIIKTLVLSFAEKNLNDLKSEFEAL